MDRATMRSLRAAPNHTPPATSIEEVTGQTISPDQHPLWKSILLHLFPGLLLATFVVIATPVFERWGLDPLYGLLVGIGVVLAPVELGYLVMYARRTTGSWRPTAAVTYRMRMPFRRILALAMLPALWMLLLVGISMAVVDGALADSVFGWLPKALTDMATVDGDAPISSGAAIVLLIAALALNGIVGPVTEELYFRGHLLPRIDRFGPLTPVLGAALFAIYHFSTPWRYPAILLGALPLVWVAWRTRSFYASLGAHLIINNVFILMMVAAFFSDAT